VTALPQQEDGGSNLVPLARPVKRWVLEVTGITVPPMSGEGVREATFTWSYQDTTSLGSGYSGEGSVIRSGEATFQLFDDGWRVRELDLHETEGGATLRPQHQRGQQNQGELGEERLTQDQALDLARATLADHEPVLNFSVHPAWDIPAEDGVSGEPINKDKVEALVALLKQHGTEVGDAKARGGYYQVSGLGPPADWRAFERSPRYGGDRSYAIFEASEIHVTRFDYDGLNSDYALLSLAIEYSGCTPACELGRELEEAPRFDYGGCAMEKVFTSLEKDWQVGRYSFVVHFKRGQDGAWVVSGVR
jgi:hypothetical protein